MKDATEDWVTEPQDRDSRETREVYALVGLALYCAQCLEHEIVNALALIKIARRQRSESVSTADKISEYQLFADRVWKVEFEKTLGSLVKSLASSGIRIPPDLDRELRGCLRDRNFLVHDYFRERAATLFAPEGRRSMAEELGAMRDTFVKADRTLHEVTMKLREAKGITEDKINLYVNLMKRGASEDEIERALATTKSGASRSRRSTTTRK